MAVSVDRVSRRYEDVTAGTPISVDVPVFETRDVFVFYGSAALVAVQGSDYTLALAGDFNTFTVTPLAALITKIDALISADATETNFIVARRELTYLTESTPAGVRYTPFTSREFDRSVMRDIQVRDEVARSVRLSDAFSTPYPDLTIYEVPADVSGSPTLVFRPDGGVGGGATTAQIAAANAAGISAAADAAQTALDRVATDEDATATAADRVATADDAVATAADRVQTGLDRTQTVADRVQTVADRVQTGLDRTAVGADRVTVAADKATTVAAKDAALLAFANFEDGYLGPSATEPTLDTDGSALEAGDLYFNTTSDVMKVYTGSAWAAAYISAEGVLLIANNLSDLANAPTALTNLGITATAAELNVLDGVTVAGAALLDDANAAAQRVTLGLVIGTNVSAPIAGLTQVQAENPASTVFGTASGQRLAQAVAAHVDVYSALASDLVAGGLGSLAFAFRLGGDAGFGATVAGSSLRPAGAARSMTTSGSGGVTVTLTNGPSGLTGTWTCLGYCDQSATATGGGGDTSASSTLNAATLWQRTL